MSRLLLKNARKIESIQFSINIMMGGTYKLPKKTFLYLFDISKIIYMHVDLMMTLIILSPNNAWSNNLVPHKDNCGNMPKGLSG